MGVMFDYFAAPSDEKAAAVIDRVGGPGSQSIVVSESVTTKRGIFGRRRQMVSPVFGTDPDLVVYPTVSVKGIDPVVQMGTLEELLTGRPYDEVMEDPRCGHDVAIRDGGELVVVTLTDSLTSALVAASDDALDRVAVPWSKNEEFWGEPDPQRLGAFLKELAGIARDANGRGHRLYCWICV